MMSESASLVQSGSGLPVGALPGWHLEGSIRVRRRPYRARTSRKIDAPEQWPSQPGGLELNVRTLGLRQSLGQHHGSTRKGLIVVDGHQDVCRAAAIGNEHGTCTCLFLGPTGVLTKLPARERRDGPRHRKQLRMKCRL